MRAVHSLLDGIERLDYRAAQRRCELLGEAEFLSGPALASVPMIAPVLFATFRDVSVRIAPERGQPGEIVWYQYESLLWTLGESARRLLQRLRPLRRERLFWQAAEALVEHAPYGKGRESWVMLLGQYGSAERVPVLLRLLEDPEVLGHALYALRRLRAPEGRVAAERLLEAPRAWIRQEARKYLKALAPAG